MNYRNYARKCLRLCEEELRNSNNERLKHAALELRMSMEAITYDRALAYKDEFPPAEYETWQPRKVMKVLLDIDPLADKDRSFAFGEEEDGVPPQVMRSLGAEKVLNMATLRKHYDALGSFLHVQSIKQIRAEKSLDFDKMRLRCEEIAEYIRAVLVSPVFNVTIGSFATMECVECGKLIRKRIPHRQKEVKVECYECHASYLIVDKGKDKVEWQPQQHLVECGKDDCNHKIVVWPHELEVGRSWTCPSCKGRNTFALGISYEDAQ